LGGIRKLSSIAKGVDHARSQPVRRKRQRLQRRAVLLGHGDISLPGNSSLSVALARTLSLGVYPIGEPIDGAFGDCKLDPPCTEGTSGTTWHNNRYSQPNPGVAFGGAASFAEEDYGQGLQAQMPAGDELPVQDASSGTPAPADGQTLRA
jgi:hypothetical protein